LKAKEGSASKEATDNQLKRIANLFKRQLSCPLLDMEETYERFNMWLVDNTGSLDSGIIDRTMVESVFKKSREKLRKIEQFEDALVSFQCRVSLLAL